MEGRKQNAGDSNQITRSHLDSLLVEMRHIGATLADTSFELYGETFSSPVMPAALSHLHRVRPDGMADVARAAKAQNTVMWAGMGSNGELDGILATGARTIKIVKPYVDNERVFDQIRHAEEAGAFAVGMDLEHAFDRTGAFDVIEGEAMSSKSLEEVAAFVKSTRLPFILKGVLSERDARLCMEMGVRGMVVSHHHGLLDYAVPPLMMLPKIAAVTKGKIPLFVDCSIENGMDVFKALALGATAVSVGRALLAPLKNGGAEGVRATLETITGELRHAMGLTASRNLAEIDPSLIHHRNW